MAKNRLSDRRKVQETFSLEIELVAIRKNLAGLNVFIDEVVLVTDAHSDEIVINQEAIKMLHDQNRKMEILLEDLRSKYEAKVVTINLENNTNIDGDVGSIDQKIDTDEG